MTNEADEIAKDVCIDVGFYEEHRDGAGLIVLISNEETVDIPEKSTYTFEVTISLTKDFIDYWGKAQESMKPIEGQTSCFTWYALAQGENVSMNYTKSKDFYVSIDCNMPFNDVQGDAWYVCK